ncbi:unnamed protein product [Allacma fusca]|uniref:Uncharacterized protein n=1 Tax=Allacma fusca TaxID=39272 RepID=A0A8J2P089_9HEXA|nr:unnamed protein product [Allacma fusca]
MSNSDFILLIKSSSTNGSCTNIFPFGGNLLFPCILLFAYQISMLAAATIAVAGTPIMPFKISEWFADESSNEDLHKSSDSSGNFELKSDYELLDSVSSSSFQVIPAYHHHGYQERLELLQENREKRNDGQGNVTAAFNDTSVVPSVPTFSLMIKNSSSSAFVNVRNEPENCTFEPAFLCLMELVHSKR